MNNVTLCFSYIEAGVTLLKIWAIFSQKQAIFMTFLTLS